MAATQLAVISTDAFHVCRKRGRKGRGQDSDEAYTDDEAISESDSDDDRLPAASAQEASADDLSSGKTKLPMLFHTSCSSVRLSNSQTCYWWRRYIVMLLLLIG